MARLGDCKCIPRKDKEALEKTIPVMKDYFTSQILKAGGHKTPGGKISIKRLQNISEIENRIKTTPICEDGDISKECKCFYTSEKEAILQMATIPLILSEHPTLHITLGMTRKIPDKETLKIINNLYSKVKKIKDCKKFGLF